MKINTCSHSIYIRTICTCTYKTGCLQKFKKNRMEKPVLVLPPFRTIIPNPATPFLFFVFFFFVFFFCFSFVLFKILLSMKINILALVYLKINFPAELMLKINNLTRPNLPVPPPPQNQMVAP